MKIKRALENEEFYIQGGSGVPFYGTATGESALSMRRDLGFGFDYLLQHYAQDYVEPYYAQKHLDLIWNEVQSRLKEDSAYLEKMRELYDEKVQVSLDFFASIHRVNFSSLLEKELFELFHKCLDAQVETIGLAHIIEAVSLGLDKELKERMVNFFSDKKVFNRAYAAVTEPSKPSFVYQEQRDLEALRNLEGSAFDEALQKHVERYFYILNSYAGPRTYTVNDCKERLASLQKGEDLSASKDEYFSQLDAEAKTLVAQIDLLATWQDDRKKYILMGITYLGRFLDELALRSGVARYDLDYLTSREARVITDITTLQSKREILGERINGMYYMQGYGFDEILQGDEYKEVHALDPHYAKDSKVQDADMIHGTVAQPGTAIGVVRVCRGLESLEKVQEGDILVASMTRPEYMPAIKKAAAIVTDEGGVTCHAAIVSRELGIPAIIGTKIATKVLKDGDTVEVKANHGAILKITNSLSSSPSSTAG